MAFPEEETKVPSLPGGTTQSSLVVNCSYSSRTGFQIVGRLEVKHLVGAAVAGTTGVYTAVSSVSGGVAQPLVVVSLAAIYVIWQMSRDQQAHEKYFLDREHERAKMDHEYRMEQLRLERIRITKQLQK